MDVSFNNVVESTRQYFQGVPTPGGSGQSSYGSAPFWPGSYQQKQQQQYPREASSEQHIQASPTRLPSLASFSTLNYRGNSGALPTLTSLKSNNQGAYDVAAPSNRYPNASGYSNFFSPQHQHHVQQQHHSQQQDPPQPQQNLQSQQQQQQPSQQQQSQIHQSQQYLHQQHSQAQHQHHPQQTTNKENHKEIQQNHSLNQQASQHSSQQSSQCHQVQITQKHHSLQSLHNHHAAIQSHQQQSVQQINQNHLSLQQSSHQSNQSLHNQQVMGNHIGNHQQPSMSHHRVQSNHHPHHQNFHDSQQVQPHSQMLPMQNHKQQIQNHKMQLIQNQQTLQSLQQNHSIGQHGSSIQHQFQSHQNSQQSHHGHQIAMSKYQMSNHAAGHHTPMGNHSGHHQSLNQMQTNQHISQHQPTVVQNHQAAMTRHSPLSMGQQHAAMTRQSPHHHHQPAITRQSPHIVTHQQGITRRSPLTASPLQHQQSITRQSPLAASQPLTSPPSTGQPPTSFVSQTPNHQQVFFTTPTTPVSGNRTTPTASAAPAMLNQVKRESPLDLSVKTIRQSADSTADSEHVIYTFHNEFLRGKASGSGQGISSQPALSAKVDFSPLSVHAEVKKRKELYTLPSVNSFSRSYDKLYQQQTSQHQQQPQRSNSHKMDARYPPNYLKRPAEPEKTQVSPKVPRIDTWKQTIDQQIEKRFNSYLSSIAVNGDKKSSFMPSMYQDQKQNGADKRVLSILRNSLETRSQQVNQQAAFAPQQHPKPPPPRYLETRLPPSTVMRPNLLPYGTMSSGGDRNRLQVPRAVDSIESSQDVVDITDDDEPPQQSQSKGELDGLAAFLAARIRTKAELKQQVTPNSKESSNKAPHIPPSASSSSGLSPRPAPGFSSMDNKDLVKNLTSSEGNALNVAAGNKGLIWSQVNSHRLPKENSLLSSMPRRRDSDSEGSEVALADLRRSSISSSLPHGPPPPPPTVSLEEEEDFNKWIILCDELVMQLQQGGRSIRKKFKRKLDEVLSIKKEEIVEDGDLDLKVKKELLSDDSRGSMVDEGEENMQLRERQSKPKIRQQRKPGPRKKKLKKLVANWQSEVWMYKKPSHLMKMGNKPLNWPRAPTSLPDLDRLNDPPPEPLVKMEQDKKSVARSLGEEKSFLDRLMQRYSDRRRKAKKYEENDPTASSFSELSSTPITGEQNLKKETIAGYRDDLPAEGDLPPDLKPKIIETNLKRRDFDEERPASAPPPGTRRVMRKSITHKNSNFLKKKKGLLLKKGAAPRLIPEKRFKTFRRKLKSSGFDYIRKKKKLVKKDGTEPPRERKKKTAPMTEPEIQAEIKGWVLNKGLGETLLHRASRIGNVDVVHYCLEKLHHNPAPRDNAGYTPLHVACSRGHLQVASLLLKYGANVSDSALGGVRPLHEAAENGFTKIVKLLLEHGADPQLATYSGVTAISLTTDEEARLLMEMHLANRVPISSVEGYPTCSNEPKEAIEGSESLASSDVEGFEIEESSAPLPNLYRLASEPRTDSWVLFHELSPLLRVKTKEALLKQLGQDAKTVLRDMKTSEFYEKAHCRAIKSSAGPKTPKVTLVKYTDTVKFLLGVETTVIPR